MVSLRLLALLLLSLALSGCAPWAPAPVEDRDRAELERPSRPGRVVQPPPPVYEVVRGDTLYSIAFRYGLDWREVAEWNRIEAPYTIRPGQSVRLTRPPVRQQAAAQPRPQPPARQQPRPSPDPEPAPQPEVSEPREQQGTEATRAPGPAATAARSVRGVEWQWPSNGAVARPFDASASRRGIGIAGTAGQPVYAAAAGEVVYSGTALIGYGELIIIKHSDTLLSAYGHNRVRMVEEGDRVRRGEQIAEMGLNERNEDMLHFEIRRNGQPEDPLGYLPRR